MNAADSCRIECTLLARAGDAPNRVALVDRGRRCTYGELAGLVSALSARLAAAGLKRGERAVLFLDKSVESVAALYATWTAGGIAVPAYEGLRSRQLKHIVDDSGARVLVTSARKLAGLEPGSTGEATVLEIGEEGRRAAPDDDRQPRAGPGGDEPAAILYTSGSTGAPKGILLSHGNLVAGARIVALYLGLHADDRVLSVLPFSFDYGLSQLLTSVRVGAALVLQRSHFPPDICRTLERERITVMAAVPPLWIQLMERLSPFPRMSFPDLRILTNSGGAFPVPLVRRYREHLPHARLFLMYGLSEAFRSTFLPPELVGEHPGSIGRAIPETEVLVVDTSCSPPRLCDDDEAGELVHSGPTVALGYWRNPQATAERFRPHPFEPESGRQAVYSGDLVRRDAEGLLHFVGRGDRLIKTQGYRVGPEEVEELIQSSGLVSTVAVCGESDPVAGMAIVAHVVPNEHFTEEAFMAFCHREMPSYMVPADVRLHASLPVTSSGKLDRNAVKDDPSFAGGGRRLRRSAAAL
jgi:acyl-CoA ligase (AMP-forming) (exosortase A-associated)